MAITSAVVLDTTPTLAASVQAVLTPLPLTAIIAGFDWDLQVAGKRINPKASVGLLLNTGGSTLTARFQATFFQAPSAAAMQTLIAAWLVTHAADWVNAPQIKYRINDNGDFDQLYALGLWNDDTTAGANYLPR